MTDRRSFFKKGLQVLLGSVLGYIALPQLTQSTESKVFAMGPKQLDLLLASKKLMDRSGMLRASEIFHYANDGQIQMDWTVAIPPEDQITADDDSIALQVLAMLSQ